MRLKVLLTTNIPAPYFVNYADELGKYVDLTVLFELNNALDRDESWVSDISQKHFKSVFLNALRIGKEKGLSFKVKRYLDGNKYNRIIIANPTTPTGIVALLYCRKHNIHFIIQSEGGFQGRGKGIKERFKKYIMENAVFYLTGMGGDDDYFLKYGGTKDRLKKYCFSSSYSSEIDERPLTKKEKDILKDKLGIVGKKIILYVGQFIYRKGIDILLEAYKGFDDNVCLCLIGGEITNEYEKMIKKNGLINIYFYPFMNKKQLTDWYRAADLFVMTTREDTWGLVVNEAMEHGLPVITTNQCIAGRVLIKEYENGFLIDSDDVKLIHEKMKLLLDNDTLRSEIGANNIKTIKQYSIEKMAETIFKYINEK